MKKFLLLSASIFCFARKSIIRDVGSCKTYPCLIFKDDFDHLDFSVWRHLKTAVATGNGEFQYYTNNRSNSFVRDGKLFLKPTLTNGTYNETFLTTGVLDLRGSTPYSECTSNMDNGCQRSGSEDSIINPIKSAGVRTAESFSFKYGKIEFKAKLPRGDWLWPAFWLMPKYNVYGEWPSSGEIDIMESRGNDILRKSMKDNILVGNQRVQQSLHWGPYWSLNAQDLTKTFVNNKVGSFADGFHVYGLEWSRKKIRFYIDHKTTLTVKVKDKGFWTFGNFSTKNPNADNPWKYGSRMAPFDEEFYIIMNLAVGGTNGFFSKNFVPKCPWNNDQHKNGEAATSFWKARNQWLPTWTDESALQIDYVKVWKMEP